MTLKAAVIPTLTDDDGHVPDFITADALEHIEFIVSGGGVVDPVDGADEGGSSPIDGGNFGGGDTEDDFQSEPDESAQASIVSAHEGMEAMAEMASSMLDNFEIQVEFDLDDLDGF